MSDPAPPPSGTPPAGVPTASAPPAPTAASLFRTEAIDAQRLKQLGDVLQVRPVPAWVFTTLAVAAAAALVTFVLWGEVARRERVEGYVEVDAGAARVLVPEAGVLAELLVKEGDSVPAGAPLARISFETTRKTDAQSTAAVQREIDERIAALDREAQQTQQLAGQQSDQQRRRIADLDKELAQFDTEIRLQEQRVANAEALAKRYAQLTEEKFVSDIVAQQRRDDVIDQQTKLAALKRQQQATRTQLEAARGELPSIGTRTSAQLEQLRRQKSELAQNRIQETAQAGRETVLRAPFAGVVSNIAVVRGQSVAADQLVALLLPQGAGLHAELLVPTRAIGFVRPGAQVLLRYEAFPFQRFGQYGGQVERISRSVWSQGDRIGPLAVREPVYTVTVRLNEQAVRAAGESFPLKRGMLVQADILAERRTIAEWIFEPVLTLREAVR